MRNIKNGHDGMEFIWSKNSSDPRNDGDSLEVKRRSEYAGGFGGIMNPKCWAIFLCLLDAIGAVEGVALKVIKEVSLEIVLVLFLWVFGEAFSVVILPVEIWVLWFWVVISFPFSEILKPGFEVTNVLWKDETFFIVGWNGGEFLFKLGSGCFNFE